MSDIWKANYPHGANIEIPRLRCVLALAEARHLLHEPPAWELHLLRVARGKESRRTRGLTSSAAAQGLLPLCCGPAGSSVRTSRWR